MRRTTILMLGALTLLALSAFGTTTASAVLPTEGPFLHVNGAKTTLNTKFAVEGSSGAGQLFTTTGGIKFKIECLKDKFTGKIGNGANFATGEGTVTFEECQLFKQETNGTDVHLCFLPDIVVTEFLVNAAYHQETETTGKTEKMQVVFEPKIAGGNFTVIKTGAGCGVLKNKEINFAGRMAASISATIERAEAEEGTFSINRVEQPWVWRPKPAEVIKMGLTANGNPAELVDKSSIRLTAGGKFGLFNS